LLFISLLFLAGLEIIVFIHDSAITLAIILTVISFFEGKNIGKSWKYAILPVFFTLSSVAQLYLVGLPYEQQIFIFLATLMYYLSLFGAWRLGKYEEDKTARGMNMAATTATIFFIYSSFYGLYLNFLVPLYCLMIAYLVTTLLISYQHFSIIYPGRRKIFPGEPGYEKNDNAMPATETSSQKTVWLYSFLLALAMTELIWTMNFWPFGYLTTGTIALILYYILWDIIQSYFLNLLSRKRVVANTVLFSVLVTLVLLSSKWIPVI
jgi:hypothetical protein